MGTRPISRELQPQNLVPGDHIRYLVDNVVRTSSTNLLYYNPLVVSICDDNWSDAQQFLTNNRKALTAKITAEGETALHRAVKTNSNDFIRNLIEMMSSDDLTIVDKDGKTALLLAVEKDNTEVVEFLVTKQPELPYIRCKRGNSPLQIAAQIGNRKMVSILLRVTKDHGGHSPYGGKDGQFLLKTLLEKQLYGSVTELLHRHPQLIGKRNQERIFPLDFIAKQPSAFFSGCSFSLLQRLLYFCVPNAQVCIFQSDEEGTKNQTKGHEDNEDGNSFTMKVQRVSLDVYIKTWTAIGKQVPYIMEIQETKLKHQEAVKLVEWTCLQFTSVDYEKVEKTFKESLISAATNGIEEIVQQILDFFPISRDDKRTEILKCVVTNRHEYILKLKNHHSYFKQMATDYKDDEGNNILHLAGQSETANRNYANRSSVFQIMYELQWFTEMEKLVPPSYRVTKNSEGKIPELIFVEAHENLLAEGERRLKETTTYCIAVSAINGTFAFAAAVSLTVNSITNDSYIFRGKAVMVFCFADALSIISSNISLFMFLVILMSRYTYRDFHRTLPQRLLMAIASLILSILSMIVASIAINYGTLMILAMLVGVAYLLFVCINNVPLFLYSRWPVLGV